MTHAVAAALAALEDSVTFQVNAYLYIGCHTLIVQGIVDEQWFVARFNILHDAQINYTDARELLLHGDTELTQVVICANDIDAARTFSTAVMEEAMCEIEAFEDVTP